MISNEERSSLLTSIRAKQPFVNNNCITNRSSILENSHFYRSINETIANKENLHNINHPIALKNEPLKKNSEKIMQNLNLKDKTTNILRTKSRLFHDEKIKGNQIISKLKSKRMI